VAGLGGFLHNFADLEALIGRVPARVVTRLSAVDFGRGTEAFYRDQMPGLLTGLADRARVESITASSAIEGVVVTGANRNWPATVTPRTTCSSRTGVR
jgi:hypothetical protein